MKVKGEYRYKNKKKATKRKEEKKMEKL